MTMQEDREVGVTRVTPEMVRIGKRFNHHATRLGLTNEGLGRRLGLTSHAVKKILDGTSCGGFAKFLRYCDALGIEPNDMTERGETSQEVITDLLEATLVGVGLDLQEARALAATVYAVYSAPRIRSVDVPHRVSLRLQCEMTARPFQIVCDRRNGVTSPRSTQAKP